MKLHGYVMGLLCFAAFSTASSAVFAAPEIKPFVRGSFQQIVSAKQGKPFIVSFWSVTCGYCMAELAMLDGLSRKYPELDLVMISTDSPEEEESVSAILMKYSLGKTDAWVFADGYTERLRFEIDRKWQGELPRTYFFGKNGETLSVSGKLEQKEVERWVKKQHSSR